MKFLLKAKSKVFLSFKVFNYKLGIIMSVSNLRDNLQNYLVNKVLFFKQQSNWCQVKLKNLKIISVVVNH